MMEQIDNERRIQLALVDIKQAIEKNKKEYEDLQKKGLNLTKLDYLDKHGPATINHDQHQEMYGRFTRDEVISLSRRISQKVASNLSSQKTMNDKKNRSSFTINEADKSKRIVGDKET